MDPGPGNQDMAPFVNARAPPNGKLETRQLFFLTNEVSNLLCVSRFVLFIEISPKDYRLLKTYYYVT